MKEFFTWRHAVISSDLAAPTKHILLTLSCHMNDLGESCFPSIQTLQKETSLSRPAIIKHIKIANELGWLIVEKHGFGGQGWRRNEYKINHPEGGQAGLPPSEKVVNEVSKRGKPESEKVVNEVNSNTSMNSSFNTSEEKPAIKKKFIPPSKDEVIQYCIDNGYPPTLGETIYNYYDAAKWHDARGNQVKNWKQKCIAVWFKPENKGDQNGKAITRTERAIKSLKDQCEKHSDVSSCI